MGLKINFPDKTNNNQINSDCYIKANKNINNNKGLLEIQVWKSKIARDSSSKKINQISIPISNETEVKDSLDRIANINIYDVDYVSGETFYAYIKTLKLNVNGQTIDLSESTDWI